MNESDTLTTQERSLLEDMAETGIHDGMNALKKLTKTEWTAFSHSLSILTRRDLPQAPEAREKQHLGGNLNVEGPLRMAVLVSYPKESVMNLVHFMAPRLASSAQSELEKYTTAEASNILANTFISVVANTLKVKILATGPHILHGTYAEMLDVSASNAGLAPDYVLSSSLRLESNQINMQCLMSVILSAEGLKGLIGSIRNSAAWSEKGHFV